MKNVLIAATLGFGVVLSGCAMNNDLLSGQFSAIKPKSTDLSGSWSGSGGPWLVTIKFNSDGTGLMCQSYNGKDILDKIKVVGDVIYNQNNLKLKVISKTNDKLTLKANYYMGATFNFTPDPLLKNASPYCESALKRLD
ncbi:J517_1871 family lipoprotein [Acinetobacter sp. ULE_I010]|uniref:J517_1871 family lipoprotein n=1 Tax=Acinetobacter sp. ULE_I010 TaxID=3373065 RepID=UPI003AF48B4C